MLGRGRRVRKIHRKELDTFLRSRGKTIHGIPLFVSSIYKVESREVRDGYQLYHFFEAMAHLHQTRDGRKRYICHPSKREELESEIRRN